MSDQAKADAFAAPVKFPGRLIASLGVDLQRRRALLVRRIAGTRSLWAKAVAIVVYEPLSCVALVAALAITVVLINASPFGSKIDLFAPGLKEITALPNSPPAGLASLSTMSGFASLPVATARSVWLGIQHPYGNIDLRPRRVEDSEDASPVLPAFNDLVALSSSMFPISTAFVSDEPQPSGVEGKAAPEPNAETAAADDNVVLAEARAVSASPTAQDTPNIPVRGVTDKEIRFGIAAPFSGSARELGRQMKLGIETAFNLVNDAGGINGRQLKLFGADDGYEPSRTVGAMNQLLDGERVFASVGNVGTPTAAVALPIALEQKMLFFAPFTGANLLRSVPPDHYVFNYRPSYAEETEAVVHYLTKVRGIQPREIAVFAQQDAYGDAGFDGVTRAFRRGGYMAPVLRLNYKRNSVDVDSAITQLRARKGSIKAVVMVATYRAAAAFIQRTRDLYPKMLYTNVSFVGSTALADELMLQGPRFADGVIVTQVVPAVNGYSRAVLDYKAALAKYFPGEAPDYVSFEGYVDAKILIEALKRVGPRVDTESLIDALEGIHDLDLGLGTILNFGPSEHQASHKVWGTQLDKTGHFNALDLD